MKAPKRVYIYWDEDEEDWAMSNISGDLCHTGCSVDALEYVLNREVTITKPKPKGVVSPRQ